jgi:hypothetical protein
MQSQPNNESSSIHLKMVDSKVTGFVFDLSGEPLAGVTVTFGTDEMVTNDLGWFYLEGQGNNVSSVLKASKSGYFDAFPAFTPQSGVNKIDFRMEEKKMATTFDAANEYKYNYENGSVSFQKESIRYENGEIYTGDVNVYIQYFDPTSDILYEIMPGNLYAQNRENEVVGLVTYGMVNVELESPSGEKLNLSKEALIRLKVPEAILSDAPSTIPLWHFDENSGLWQEEGKAFLKDDYYEGTVSHFSFWNCDDPRNLVWIEFRLLSNNNIPIRNTQVCITDLAENDKRIGYTDSEGYVSGFVPKGNELSISLSGGCLDELEVGYIGIFNEDKNIGDILVSFPSDFISKISGTVVICEEVDPKTVKVFIRSSQIVKIVEIASDGSFLYDMEYCEGESFRIEVFSTKENLYTISQDFLFKPSNEEILIEHCNTITSLEGSVIFKFENKWISDMEIKSFEIIDVTENSQKIRLVFFDKFITNDSVHYIMEIEEKVYTGSSNRVYTLTLDYDYGNETYTRLYDFKLLQNVQSTTAIFYISEFGDYSIIQFEKLRISDKTTGVIDNSGMLEIRALTN